MKKLFVIAAALGLASAASAQNLPSGWDELTSPEFPLAVEKSEGVCVIPMGVIEKHGPQLPLGTDVFSAREVSRRAAEKEYAIIYPFYYMGQIFEAKHQPGTIAYSPELLYKMLEETCDEISRNGIKKIIFANSHGGNTTFLQYFCQTQLYKKKDYVVYLYQPSVDRETQEKITSLRKSTVGGHADEVETSTIMVIKPELMRMAAVNSQSGENLRRLNLRGAYTGIGWYSQYPNHYAGESSGASVELGELRLASWSANLAEVIKRVKDDDVAARLQGEFFEQSEQPLETPVW
ncbi:MAG: creatininase family protein [Alistipes sp.]|jgi:creatinine amidohydrolase|nr:creatininase family protein [Alistipes sp.]